MKDNIEGLYKALKNSASGFYTSNLEDAFATEKFYQAILSRIQSNYQFSLTLHNEEGFLVPYEKNRTSLLPYTEETRFERTYNNEDCIYIDLLEDFSGLGDVVTDGCLYNYEIAEAQCHDDTDTGEVFNAFLAERGNMGIAKMVLGDAYYDFALAIPDLADTIVGVLLSYPVDEIEIRFCLFKSPLIGAFLCADLPISDPEVVLVHNLIVEVQDPFYGQTADGSGYYMTGSREGVWYNLAWYGLISDYEEILFNDLRPEWYPACKLLRKKLEMLNRKYRFKKKEVDDGISQSEAA